MSSKFCFVGRRVFFALFNFGDFGQHLFFFDLESLQLDLLNVLAPRHQHFLQHFPIFLQQNILNTFAARFGIQTEPYLFISLLLDKPGQLLPLLKAYDLF